MRWRTVVGAVSVAVLVAAGCGDDSDDAGETTTTTTSADESTASVAEPTTSTEATSTTEADDPSPRAVGVTRLSGLPWANPDSAHVHPIAAVEEFMAFVSDATVGGLVETTIVEYRQVDQRSGEADLAFGWTHATTVLVHQAGPHDYWWVLGAESLNAQIRDPAPDMTIDSPFDLVLLRVELNEPRTFQVYASGSSAPLYRAVQDSFVVGPAVTSIDLSSCDDAPALEDDSVNGIVYNTGPVFTDVTVCDGPGLAGEEGTLILSGATGVTTVPVVFAST
jgi:hypothetical protein